MKQLVNTICLSALLFTPVYGEEIDELSLASSIYSSQRAFQVGDLVTVMVSEETSSSKSESLDTDKSASADLQEMVIGGSEKNVIWQHAQPVTPPVSIGASSNFSGSGQAANSESLKASYTARVVNVHPNGVLVIRGERAVEKNGEKVEMVLTGTIRKQDIAANNTIDSTKMADARIFYKTSGDVSNGSKPGFIWRFFQKINPF